ncbi:MAG: hypothetical protein ACFFDN_10140 [Candidatus Hodarchaeota archaeon]
MTNDKEDSHIHFMKIAIEESKKTKGEKGRKIFPKVGAVVEKDGKFIEKGCRGELADGEHAEYGLLERKCVGEDLNGATLYTTLEPCTIRGHPKIPCAKWIKKRGFKKVFIGMLDPNPHIYKNGFWALEDYGIEVDFFPPYLRAEIQEINKDFIKNIQKPEFVIANREQEKQEIWRLFNSLQFGDASQRLLWFCGPAGIGKTEILRWVRETSKIRGLIDCKEITLGQSGTLFDLLILAGGKPLDLEEVKNIGGNIEDYVCNILTFYLTSNNKPCILILDTDNTFDDIDGLCKITNLLLSKMELKAQIGIVIASRQPPEDFKFLMLKPLDHQELQKMFEIKNWEIKDEKVTEVYKLSNGNPLKAIIINSLIKFKGGIAPNDSKEALKKLLSYLPSQAKEILETLAVGLSAPFEMVKIMAQDILIKHIENGEKFLDDLIKMGLVQKNSPKITMHDELAEKLNEILPFKEKLKIHKQLALNMEKTDPLGSFWHYMKANEVVKAVRMLEPARFASSQRLETKRYIQVTTEGIEWFDKLSRRNISNKLKFNFIFYKGLLCLNLSYFENPIEFTKRAINIFNEGLSLFKPLKSDFEYVQIYYNLGLTFSKLGAFEKTELNCEKAIELLEKALEYKKMNDFPRFLINIMNSLGSAYAKLAEIKDGVHNCKKSIEIFEKTLNFEKIKDFPIEHSNILMNQGNVYKNLATLTLELINLEVAIKKFESALKISIMYNLKTDYAMINYNLGSTYTIIAEFSAKSKNLNKAIKSFEEALKIYSQEHFSMEYARTLEHLGITYGQLARIENPLKNIEKAISFHQKALKIRTYENFPVQHVNTLNNLGAQYLLFAGICLERESKIENLQKAIKNFKFILNFYQTQNLVESYVNTIINLGHALFRLGEIENKIEYYNESIESMENVIKFYDLKEFPLLYAKIYENLALGYSKLGKKENKIENCNKALSLIEKSENFITPEEHKDFYANVQLNKSAIYLELAEEIDKSLNSKKAIAALNLALKIYNMEETPIDYIKARFNLGNAYRTLAEVENKTENCKMAIKILKQTLKVINEEELKTIYENFKEELEKALKFCQSDIKTQK